MKLIYKKHQLRNIKAGSTFWEDLGFDKLRMIYYPCVRCQHRCIYRDLNNIYDYCSEFILCQAFRDIL